jgi:1-acyl-sn-glycerol-3-phosphate acyltransferase
MLARRGVGRLALAADVPVVPVAQWGAQAVFGPGLRMRPRRLYSVLAGPPLDVMPGGSASAVTAELMVRIRDQLADLRGEPAPRRVWDPKQGARTSESHVRTEGVAA